MSTTHIQFAFERLNKSGKEITETQIESFFTVAASKCMLELVKDIIDRFRVVPTISQFLDWCLPPKPDHPEVERYLELTRLFLSVNAELVRQTHPTTLENCVFRAADRGSLPHVKFFLDAGADVDASNDLGNSPLWIACAKRYPCIVDELLARGADVNKLNWKGNPPMYVCFFANENLSNFV